MFNFYLYHNNKTKQDLTYLLQASSLHIWETCQRQIIMSNTSIKLLPPGFTTYSGTEAFIFLLEIILGLHSKLIGEPEVLGQFKNRFLKHSPITPWDHQSHNLYSFLVKEAKKIRTTFLKNNGNMTYGGLIQHYIEHESHIDLIGSGHLAQELLPWILKNTTCVVNYSRNIMTAQTRLAPIVQRSNTHLKYQQLSTDSKFINILIIAAPLLASELHTPQLQEVQLVIDLRETAHVDLLPHAHVITLNQLYAQKHQNQIALQQKLPTIQQEIDLAAHKWFYKSIHRPLGWEETCLYA